MVSLNRLKTWKPLNLLLAMLLLFTSGCKTGLNTWWYLGEEKPHQEQYRENMLEIDSPDVAQPTPEGIETTAPPRTLADRERDEIWDLGIEEAIHLALANSEIIRTSGQFLSPQNNLLANPLNVASVYDPAIRDSGVLFGGVGTEAALAAFDTTWATSMFWGRNEINQNSNAVPTLLQDTVNFNTSLKKQFAYGAQFTVSHQVNSLGTNVTTNPFPSVFTGNLQAEYRQQLLAGSGPDFVRVAGPLNANFASIAGVSNGVLIARINADISITNFEANVRNLVKGVEDTYWDLYLAYRNFDTAVTARNTALDTWRVADAKRRLGGVRGFSNSEEAQARDRYFETRAQAETALGNLYATEQRLRNLMGLPINDNRIIRPSMNPITAKIQVDWYHCLAEALTERVELRRQKWNIKSLELQLGAAKNFARPRFDLVARARTNGFGDTLASRSDRDIFGGDRNSFYEKLAQGNQTGWDFGFEYTVPFGLRLAKSQVSNLELRLTKARKVLAAQELEIGHELAVAFQDIERTYATAVSNYSRRAAALERVKMIGQELQVGSGANTLDRYLRAQESLAAAENAYHQSLVDYNKALVNLYYRRGTLLQQDNIHLLEGKWHPEAYQQAFARAKARAHAIPAPRLETLPAPFAADGHLNQIGFAAPEAAQESQQELPPMPEEVELPLPDDEEQTTHPVDKNSTGTDLPPAPGEFPETPSEEKKPAPVNPPNYFEKDGKKTLKLPLLENPKKLDPSSTTGRKLNTETGKAIPDPESTAPEFPASEKRSGKAVSTIPTVVEPKVKGGWRLKKHDWRAKQPSPQPFPVLPVGNTEKADASETLSPSSKPVQQSKQPKKMATEIGKAVQSYR